MACCDKVKFVHSQQWRNLTTPLQTSWINYSNDSLSKAKSPRLRLFIRKGERQGKKRKQKGNQSSCKSCLDMMKMIIQKTRRANHYLKLLLMTTFLLSQTSSPPPSNFQGAFRPKCSTKPTLLLSRKELGTKIQTRVNRVLKLLQMVYRFWICPTWLRKTSSWRSKTYTMPFAIQSSL